MTNPAIKPVILIVEDEAALVSLIRYNLEKAGFAIAEAGDGADALTVLAEQDIDLVLLDWMLPSVSGIEVCRRMRRQPETRNIPVIMLTARGEEGDRIRGLNAGADDYITKPFSHDELIARIHAVLRRLRPALSEEVLRYADVELNTATHRVTRAARQIHLGPTEFRLLHFLMEHPGRVFARDRLIDAVWGQDIYVEERTVDVHIRRLRKALNTAGAPDIIRTVRAAGYALDDAGPEPA